MSRKTTALEKRASVTSVVRTKADEKVIILVSIALLVVLAVFISRSGVFSTGNTTDDRVTLDEMKNESWEQLTGLEKKEIGTLINKADILFINDSLVSSKGDNAYELYKEVLEIHPGNRYAIAQLNLIRKDFLKHADGEIIQKNYNDAENILQTGLNYFTNDPELVELHKTNQILLFYDEARELYDKNEIDQAFSKIKQIEELNPDYNLAHQLKEKIGEYYLAEANRLYDQKQYSQSKFYYKKSQSILANQLPISGKLAKVNTKLAVERQKEKEALKEAERLVAEQRAREEVERLAAEQRAKEELERHMAEEEKKLWLGIEFIPIKGGTFEMGDLWGDGWGDEKPVHTVTVRDFYISKYEITFSQFDAFCDATGRIKPPDKGWGRGNRPVINVSWHEAVAFCEWLSQMTGTNVRLPTEAEWEYAARSGGKHEKWAGTNNGNSLENFTSYGNIGTHSVGQKQPNGLGLYNMSGNVFEWCSDWYGEHSYKLQNNQRSFSSSGKRVIRGGSWNTAVQFMRCTSRNAEYPNIHRADLGFRVCKER